MTESRLTDQASFVQPDTGARVRDVGAERPRTRPSADPRFMAIYRGELTFVWNVARRLGIRTGDIEDVVQEVFFRVARLIDTYDPQRPIRPWLVAITFRVASEQRRGSARIGIPSEEAHDPPGSVDDPEQAIARAQDRSLVLRALEAIPLDRRVVFVAHELDGLPIPEIAEAVEIPLNTAYSRLRIARQEFATAARALRGGGQ